MIVQFIDLTRNGYSHNLSERAPTSVIYFNLCDCHHSNFNFVFIYLLFVMYTIHWPIPTWFFRLPLGILLVCPREFQTSQNRSMRNSAAEWTSCAMLWMPLPRVYWGRNHCAKSESNLLPLRACAMILISAGTAHTGTFLQ